MLDRDELYAGREQAFVKHHILRTYLERFAHIVGSKWPSITYIDGFSGPWETHSDNHSDSSFSIAIEELRKARNTLQGRGKDLAIRCVFVEKNPDAYKRLMSFTESIRDVEILPINSEFESAIPAIVEFVKQDADTFQFTLIDPKGWKGFSMRAIEPLLKLKPGEVLINFMLEFIRHFIEHEGSRNGFIDLFGTDQFKEELATLDGTDRDDAITEKYCQCLSESCNYPHVLRASVFHPNKDRVFYQFIYATRDLRGIEVFKEAELKAMKAQEDQRAQSEKDKKQQGGQGTFLDFDDPPESDFYNDLRNRYLRQSKTYVTEILNCATIAEYDQLWVEALRSPLVWRSDLNKWLQEWREQGLVRFQGLKPQDRVLKRDKGHQVERLAKIVE